MVLIVYFLLFISSLLKVTNTNFYGWTMETLSNNINQLQNLATLAVKRFSWNAAYGSSKVKNLMECTLRNLGQVFIRLLNRQCQPKPDVPRIQKPKLLFMTNILNFKINSLQITEVAKATMIYLKKIISSLAKFQ